MDHDHDATLLQPDETFRIRGAIYEVRRAMGAGFLEAVYQECLSLEFTSRGIPFVAGQALALHYKGVLLKQSYVPDFLCFDRVIVELKAVSAIAPEHRSQLLNYLKASRLRVGLLVNFGSEFKVQIERMVC